MSTLTIDDNDARISYRGGHWETLKGSSQQFKSTVHSTWDFNASATLSFTGTGVRIYATAPAGKGTGVVAFSLNADTEVTVWTPSGATPVYGKELFYSGVLPFGTHTIAMYNRGEDNDEDFELDRVVIEQEPPSSSPPAPPISTTSARTITTPSNIAPTPTSSSWSSNSSSSNSTSHLSAAATNSAPSASTSTSGNFLSNNGTPVSSGSLLSTPAAATAGSSLVNSTSVGSTLVPKIVGSLAGILGLLAILFFLLFCRRRSKMKKEARSRSLGETPTPFHLDRHTNPVVTREESQSLSPLATYSSTGAWTSISERDTTHFPGRPPLSLQIPTDPFQEKISLKTSLQSTSNPFLPLPFTLNTRSEDRPPSYRQDV